jgi:hypothetical protein
VPADEARDALESDEPAPAAEPPAGSSGGRAWGRGERVPCPDGMCTGIIGPKGRCGTCQKPWDWKDRR